MKPGTTELDMPADLYTRNILDRKSSIFEPKGKVIWRRTCIKREI